MKGCEEDEILIFFLPFIDQTHRWSFSLNGKAADVNSYSGDEQSADTRMTLFVQNLVDVLRPELTAVFLKHCAWMLLYFQGLTTGWRCFSLLLHFMM